MQFSSRLSLKAIWLAVALIAFSNFNLAKWNKQQVLAHDMYIYYSYLPAAFIYQDLSFGYFNDLRDSGEKGEFWTLTAPNGQPVQKMSMGVAYCYLPFFLIGHTAALVGPWEANGYSIPYHFVLALASMCFAALGLIQLRKLLLNYFSEAVTAITVLCVALGTNFYYYTTVEAAMSHVFSFFLMTSVLLLIKSWLEKPQPKTTILLGLCIGLIALIRPTNVILVLTFLLFDIQTWSDLKARFMLLIGRYTNILFMLIACALIWVPQVTYWHAFTGDWFYYSYGDEHFFFNNPKILDGLFSFRKGWFIYTPIMLLATLGLYHLWQSKNPWRLVLLIFVPVNLFIVFSWWCWWYGGSFSQRVMIDSYGLMALPLAAILSHLITFKPFIRVITGSLVISSIALNQFQIVQYRKALLHWDSMTKEAYIAIFGRLNYPENYQQLISEPDYNSAKKGFR